jgi:hypothetical protein
MRAGLFCALIIAPALLACPLVAHAQAAPAGPRAEVIVGAYVNDI